MSLGQMQQPAVRVEAGRKHVAAAEQVPHEAATTALAQQPEEVVVGLFRGKLIQHRGLLGCGFVGCVGHGPTSAVRALSPETSVSERSLAPWLPALICSMEIGRASCSERVCQYV